MTTMLHEKKTKVNTSSDNYLGVNRKNVCECMVCQPNRKQKSENIDVVAQTTENMGCLKSTLTTATVCPHVYICSPLRPISTDPILRANELIDNLKLAKDACTFAALRGCEPVAPHLYYPQFLNDDDEFERALGMELGIRALRACDELWIISPRISSGMSAEIKEAQKCGIKVLVFTAAGFREYRGSGDMTDNCYADTADTAVID